PAHSRGHLYVTCYTEGFSHFVTSMTAPLASGWSVWPGGACTHWKAPPCHGAHVERTFRNATTVVAVRRIVFSNGSRWHALLDVDTFGRLRSLRARSSYQALGVPSGQFGEVAVVPDVNFVGHALDIAFGVKG